MKSNCTELAGFDSIPPPKLRVEFRQPDRADQRDVAFDDPEETLPSMATVAQDSAAGTIERETSHENS
jgi:hypothetical protein